MHPFVVVGCTHTTASLEEVARARVTPALLQPIRDALGVAELVYLETCHRTEWYLAYEGEQCPGRLVMTLAHTLPALSGGTCRLPTVDRCLARRGADVARHLFRVAGALDSLMVGEAQVLGQVKEALRRAANTGLAGPLLRTLFEQSFRTAKRIRAETSLGRGAVSLVSLASRHLQELLADDGRGVAILGAGEMAARSARLVRKLSPTAEIEIFNRSPQRAASLARRIGARSQPLSSFPGGRSFSVVIAATAAPEPLVTPATAAALAPVSILDLGLPANVAPACRGLSGVTVIDQTALGAAAATNRKARLAALTRAEAIVEEQLEELAQELFEHRLSPVARSLVVAFAEASRRELAAAGLPAQQLDAAVERLSQRLVRVPLRGLRQVAWQHSPAVLDTFLNAVKR